jgi:hypothetical protein
VRCAVSRRRKDAQEKSIWSTAGPKHMAFTKPSNVHPAIIVSGGGSLITLSAAQLCAILKRGGSLDLLTGGTPCPDLALCFQTVTGQSHHVCPGLLLRCLGTCKAWQPSQCPIEQPWSKTQRGTNTGKALLPGHAHRIASEVGPTTHDGPSAAVKNVPARAACQNPIRCSS